MKRDTAGTRTTNPRATKSLFEMVMDNDVKAVEQKVAGLRPEEKLSQLKNNRRGGSTALHAASSRGNSVIVEKLLEGLSPKQRTTLLAIEDSGPPSGFGHRTATHLASEEGHADVVRAQLASLSSKQIAAQLAITAFGGQTATHLASEEGHADVVRAQLASLSSKQIATQLAITDSGSDTATHRASAKGHADVVTAQLTPLSAEQIAAQLAFQNKHNGNTATHEASKNGHADVVTAQLSTLSQQQISTQLAVQNRSGNTAIHKAAQRGYADVVNLLIEKGADLNVRNHSGKTAADVAWSKGHRQLAINIEEARHAQNGEVGQYNKFSASVMGKLSNFSQRIFARSKYVPPLPSAPPIDDLTKAKIDAASLSVAAPSPLPSAPPIEALKINTTPLRAEQLLPVAEAYYPVTGLSDAVYAGIAHVVPEQQAGNNAVTALIMPDAPTAPIMPNAPTGPIRTGNSSTSHQDRLNMQRSGGTTAATTLP